MHEQKRQRRGSQPATSQYASQKRKVPDRNVLYNHITHRIQQQAVSRTLKSTGTGYHRGNRNSRVQQQSPQSFELNNDQFPPLSLESSKKVEQDSKRQVEVEPKPTANRVQPEAQPESPPSKQDKLCLDPSIIDDPAIIDAKLEVKRPKNITEVNRQSQVPVQSPPFASCPINATVHSSVLATASCQQHQLTNGVTYPNAPLPPPYYQPAGPMYASQPSPGFFQPPQPCQYTQVPYGAQQQRTMMQPAQVMSSYQQMIQPAFQTPYVPQMPQNFVQVH